MRTFFRRLESWRWLRKWKGGVRHQVTWSGLAFTLLIILLGLAAFASGNNLLFLLLAAMLSTMLISGLVSRLGLAGLEVRLVLPDHVFARRQLPARVQLSNSKRWMPSFSIHLQSVDEEESPERIYFPIVPGGSTMEAITSVRFKKRGLVGDSQYQFTTRFPFGFTERRVQIKLRREVLVYPSIEAQPGFDDLARSLQGDIEDYLRGRGHDFYRIRPYEFNESARHVDWKATAHTGDLQVREFAREEEHLVEICLDLCVPSGQEAWMESAIDCCAYLAWRLAARGSRIRFLSQHVDLRIPETADVYAILKYLAEAQPVARQGILVPYERNSFKIVFSLSPASLRQNGWDLAHVVDGGAFDRPSGGAERPAR